MDVAPVQLAECVVELLVECHDFIARQAHEQTFQCMRVALRLGDERPELVDRQHLRQCVHAPYQSLGSAERPWPSASGFSPAGSGSPCSPAMRLRAAISAILPRVTALALAMCGTTMQLGRCTSG